MEIKTTTFRFNRHKGSGPRENRNAVVFPGPVTQATAFLQGFDVAFSQGQDHHFGNLIVSLSTTIDELAPQRVYVDAAFGLRDWSDDWDDNYEGEIIVTVVGE